MQRQARAHRHTHTPGSSQLPPAGWGSRPSPRTQWPGRCCPAGRQEGRQQVGKQAGKEAGRQVEARSLLPCRVGNMWASRQAGKQAGGRAGSGFAMRGFQSPYPLPCTSRRPSQTRPAQHPSHLEQVGERAACNRNLGGAPVRQARRGWLCRQHAVYPGKDTALQAGRRAGRGSQAARIDSSRA